MYSACGGTITDFPAQIRYPFSGPYPHSDDCTWILNTSVPIDIQFERFHLEYHSNCGYDYLKIIENGILLEIYCGFMSPPNLTLNGNISFSFHSDGIVNRDGFIIDIGKW